jgi:hypothetical protein
VKIVFLDFDGPIIPVQSHVHNRSVKEKAWPPCVKALNRITDSTGAKIVVTSSWRDTSAKNLFYGQAIKIVQTLLKQWGVTGEVLGQIPYCIEIQGNYAIEAPRGQEIASFLKICDNVESFVILDDDDDMEDLREFLIQTPFEKGLTEADADRAIRMLSQ